MSKARKPRPAGTIEAALTHTIETLGTEECRLVTGIPASRLWAMSDPGQPARISAFACLQLDRAMVDAGHMPVIAAALGDEVERRIMARSGAAPGCPTTVALRLGWAAGIIQGAVAEATDPQSNGGGAITPREAAQIGEWIADLRNRLFELERSIVEPAPPAEVRSAA